MNDILSRSFFNQPTSEQHSDSIRHLLDDRDVVSNEDHR